MKKIILLFIIIGICDVAFAQITTPVVKANFGVEADLSSNYFNALTQPAVDDWFNFGYIGTGKGLIDTTGAAAIVAGYLSNPASRKLSFQRPMAYPPYTIVNNRIVLDAVYYRDYHGVDSTVYASGSNKNGMNPGFWSTPVAQSIPDKNDILEAMVHVRRAGPNVTDSLWLFAGISLENITGNRFFDFELYQSDISYDKSTRKFTGYGPNGGHTLWKFDAAGNILSPGDIIFTAEYSSSALTLVEARIWVNKSMLTSITPTSFNWGGKFDGDGSSATYGYANILPKTTGNFYTGMQSIASATWAGPFKVVRDNETVLNDYVAGQFMEFSVNLTKLGIEPANYKANACGSAFIRVLIKTRASTSFTAELKDFIAPFKFFNYSQVDANSFLTYFCGVMPETSISVTNPNPASTYTWSTTNGSIIGPNTGPAITTSTPGIYYVQQQLNAACPASSMDSIEIFFNPICTILDINITQLQALVLHDQNVIKWQASNNQDALSYDIEYSTDNLNFSRLGSIKANSLSGIANYEFQHSSNKILSPIVYYRIRVIGKNGAEKFSNIVVLRSLRSDINDALVFPNPTTGKLWLSCTGSKNEIAEVNIFDYTGKKIISSTHMLNIGENILELPSLFGKSLGTYLIRIRTSTGFITQKVILRK